MNARAAAAIKAALRIALVAVVVVSALVARVIVAGELAIAESSRALLEGDARAATDADGLNGQTALFHTVSSNANRSAPVMNLLLAAGARPDIQLAGITWGKGFDWETICFDVTPISYAQFGLLPQMQRTEHDCYANVRALLRAAGRPIPALDNVPNRYLA